MEAPASSAILIVDPGAHTLDPEVLVQEACCADPTWSPPSSPRPLWCPDAQYVVCVPIREGKAMRPKAGISEIDFHCLSRMASIAYDTHKGCLRPPHHSNSKRKGLENDLENEETQMTVKSSFRTIKPRHSASHKIMASGNT